MDTRAHGRPSSFKILLLNAIRNQCRAVAGIPRREREREELLTFGTDGAHANEASPARETRRRNRLTRVLGDLASRIWRHAQVCCQRDWNQDERPGRNDTCLKQGKIRIRRMVTFRSLNRRYRSWPNRERFVTIWRILDFSLSISYLVRFIRVWILVGWIIFFSFFIFFWPRKTIFRRRTRSEI